MKQWQAKELAKLAQVSVRTLHHYDKIGLLKPSCRMSNNYRLYSEKDLLKLQQIIALKFFGFKLKQIQNFLSQDSELFASIDQQSQLLRNKATAYLEASKMLDLVTLECKENKSIPWQNIIELIEVYNMTQNIQDSWVKEIFTPQELKEYVEFETEFKENSSLEEKSEFEQEWFQLVEGFKNNLETIPNSVEGIQLGKKLIDWVNKVYGKKYAHLRTKKFHDGFAAGKGLAEHGLTAEIVKLMEQTMDAYFQKNVQEILKKIDKSPAADVLNEWQKLMDEAFGNQKDRKLETIRLIINDEKTSLKAKKWLQENFLT